MCDGFEQVDFVPAEVLGDQTYAPEPRWGKMQQMPYIEFYQGLRERNWTSEHYKPDAPLWRIQFFEDSGRFLRPAFSGLRWAEQFLWYYLGTTASHPQCL